MNKGNIIAKAFQSEKVLCGIVSVAFPVVIILYFCARNVGELSGTAIAIGITFVLLAATAAYLAVLLLFRNPFATMCFCVICWAGCFLQPAISGILPETMEHNKLLVTTLLIISVATPVTFVLSKKVEKQIRVEQFLTAILGMMFVFNIVPFVNAAIQIQRHPLGKIPIKESFEIEEDTALPNVFWIHADGMLGMDAFERYFNDPQSEFCEALSERGFEVNKSAYFEAGHSTAFAIPVLTNPYSYDNYLNQLTETHETAMTAKSDLGNLAILAKLRQNNELMRAFEEKGYTINLVAGDGLSTYYIPTKDSALFLIAKHMVTYNVTESGAYQRMTVANDLAFLGKLSLYFSAPGSVLIRLFSEAKFENQEPYKTQMGDEELQQTILAGWADESSHIRCEVEALYEVLHGNYRTPRLTVIHDATPHYPYLYNENGEIIQEWDNVNPLDYYPQHIYCTKILLNMIDMILAVDPDAVIVIQADHGLHGNTEKDFKAAFGEDADPLELWNNTMSAIRVPEKYRTGEEHYAMENPLNISRYLVNSFVGQNYEYLPPN